MLALGEPLADSIKDLESKVSSGVQGSLSPEICTVAYAVEVFAGSVDFFWLGEFGACLMSPAPLRRSHNTTRDQGCANYQ